MKHQTVTEITIWDDRDIALGLRVADLCGALIEVESRM